MLAPSQAARRYTQLVRPSYHAEQHGTSTTATSMTATIPAGASVDDYAIFSVSTINTDSIPSTPSGWTLLKNITPPTNLGLNLWVWAKRLVSGDPGSTIVFTGLGNHARSWAIVAYQNVGGIDVLPAEYTSSINESGYSL